MSNRTPKVLAVLTIVVCAGAFLVVRAGKGPPPPPAPGAALPALAANINNVGSLSISRSTGSVSLTRGGADAPWIVPAKAGYPADVERVRQTLLQLQDLQLAEPKTSNPEYFPRLGLQDVKVATKEAPKPEAQTADNKDGAAGALVEIKDTAGKPIASLIVGNSADIGNATLDRPMQSGQFVRRPGEMQSWLTKGTIFLDAEPMNWIDRKVVGIPRDRIKSAAVSRLVGTGPAEVVPEKPDLLITRKDKDAPAFEATGLPEGRTFKSSEAVDQPVQAVGYLGMEDVIKDPDGAGGGIIGSPDPAATGENAAHPAAAQFATFDGLLINVKTGFRDGKWWASVNAEATGDTLPKADPSKTSDKGAEEKTRTDAAKEAAEINKRCKGWLFAVSQFDAKRLSTKLDEMLAPVTPPANPTVGPSPAPPSPDAGTPLPPKEPAPPSTSPMPN